MEYSYEETDLSKLGPGESQAANKIINLLIDILKELQNGN